MVFRSPVPLLMYKALGKGHGTLLCVIDTVWNSRYDFSILPPLIWKTAWYLRGIQVFTSSLLLECSLVGA